LADALVGFFTGAFEVVMVAMAALSFENLRTKQYYVRNQLPLEE
jgi:hypothetical protein